MKAAITKLENKIGNKRSRKRERKEKNELSRDYLHVKRIGHSLYHFTERYFHCLGIM